MIALKHARLHRLELSARMPFRYGIATMTRLPHVILALTFEIEGHTVTGLAADNLPPKWFTKDPTESIDHEIAGMLSVLRRGVEHARGIRAASVFDFWQELYAAQAAWSLAEKIPPLLAHFGTSLVERALIDGFCRSHGVPFADALRENRFGVELGRVREDLAGSSPRNWLPARPAEKLIARHTVGLSDPLDDGDIALEDRVNDGLPQSLVACLKFYGLRHFKIKINGEFARDCHRLERMVAIFSRECVHGWACSLDGNESFREVGPFTDYMRGLRAAPGLKLLWPRLLFIEQPWHRDVALAAAIAELTQAWPDRPPIIIDESDAELSSLPTALSLGYAGTSHKNCKGVFKSVLNACTLARRRASGATGWLSGEDLSNVGPVALLQDLAVQSTLGIESVERNGHHYFAGLSAWPDAVQQHVLAHHGDLYTRSAAGWPRVNVQHGAIELASVLRTSLGAEPPPLDEIPAIEW